MNMDADMCTAKTCYQHLKTIFHELEEIRPFEILRYQEDRVDYLMTKQSKIIAMTCTHAALRRKDFIRCGLTYDSLLIEEAGQILEIETFIPMVLQKQLGPNDLKRIILIGDHHQLPPVVRNIIIKKYSHLDQSLFSRFVRLGIPYIELDTQGRALPSLAKLYNWRYACLRDLPKTMQLEKLGVINPGFVFNFQFIDVANLQGMGESKPAPYFYQNLAEAEFLVSVYQYMRLLGYPPWKITVLTTYNGQKMLLNDIIDKRCADRSFFGWPKKVTTVDQYQGQQNDYILLSLVKTHNVGHLRDVRRLIVAMSRARLGLYIFGRANLYTNCQELWYTLEKLLLRPTTLALQPSENWGQIKRQMEQKRIVAFDLKSMSNFVMLKVQQSYVATS
jgi:intron-binding protein aquarius